ncbi:MAG TPA: CopD family protein [Planctomycetota bacterium]|nr:CopD family protein [Planctomycetota bacterium]
MVFWIGLHILAATLWVGGMMFVHLALRPTLTEVLEPPQRLAVWLGVLNRFFPRVWWSILLLHVSGMWVLLGVMGGMAQARLHVHLMLGIAWVMTGIFAYLYFGPFQKLRTAVAQQDWPTGRAQMGRLRTWVTTNLVLGTLVMVIGATGRYW